MISGLMGLESSSYQKQKATLAQQSGLVGTGAVIDSNFNVSNDKHKSDAVKMAGAFSFSDQLKGQMVAQADSDKTKDSGEDKQNTLDKIIAEGEAKAQELSKVNGGKVEFFCGQQYLTDEDRAVIDQIAKSAGLSESERLSMGLCIATDRQSGLLKGPLTMGYFFGKNGLFTSRMDMKDFYLKGEQTDSVLNVMQKMRSLMASVEQALKDAGIEDKSDNLDFQREQYMALLKQSVNGMNKSTDDFMGVMRQSQDLMRS